jgi:hypothetical protein
MRAPSLIATPPQDPWDWYFLMQHSGAPTRRLDWTEGSLIALYFAVRDAARDNDASADAAVWVLDPWWLNKLAVDVAEVITPSIATGIAKRTLNATSRGSRSDLRKSNCPNSQLPSTQVIPSPLACRGPASQSTAQTRKRSKR